MGQHKRSMKTQHTINDKLYSVHTNQYKETLQNFKNVTLITVLCTKDVHLFLSSHSRVDINTVLNKRIAFEDSRPPPGQRVNKMSKHTKWLVFLKYCTRALKEIFFKGQYFNFFQRSIFQKYQPMRVCFDFIVQLYLKYR